MPLYPKIAHATSHHGKKASDSNRAFRGIGIPWHIPRLDSEFDPIAEGDASFVGTLTQRSADVFGYIDASAAEGARFTNETTDAGDAGNADVLVIPAVEAVGDYMLIGDADPIISTQFDYNNGTAGVGGAMTCEICVDGPNDIWEAVTQLVDETSDFTTATADDLKIAFALSDNWTPQVLSEVSTTLSEVDTPRFYYRQRVTTVFSTNPVLDQVQLDVLEAGAITAGIIAPMTGLMDQLQWVAETASGSANDIILEFLNYTRQTRGTVTIPKTTPRGRAAFGQALYVERDDELGIRCIQEDGTTEITDVRLIPEITL